MSDQPKKQELPPEDAAYLKQAEEFLIQSAKMGNAPLAYMIAAAFKNEAANKKLRADNEALRADNEAKDARIAELEALIPGFVYGKSMLVPIGSAGDLVAMNNRVESAEAKLKSVEGLLEEKPERWYSSMHNGFAYTHISVDALLARLREAIK